MALEQKLHLKLSQKLIMTPSLQQAIKLLQLSKLELQEVLNQELLENPLLEESAEEAKQEEAEAEAQEKTQTEEEAKAAEPAPEKEKDSFDEIDYDAYFQDYIEYGYNPRMGEEHEEFPIENTPHPSAQPHRSPDLAARHERRLADGQRDRRLHHRQHRRRRLPARHATRRSPLPVRYDPADVEKAIAAIQSLDPIGVGARDLRECLLLQLRVPRSRQPAGRDDRPRPLGHVHAAPVRADRQGARRRHEDARGRRRDHQAPRSEARPQVLERARHLRRARRLHPARSATSTSSCSTKTACPSCASTAATARMLNSMDSKSDGETVNYIKDKIRSAVWLIKTLDQRQRTIYKVAESIVRQQREFLEKGIEYLRPLVLRDVADDIRMHESTVSRVVSNKYMHTPRGLFLMKYFFHSGIDSDTATTSPASRSRRRFRASSRPRTRASRCRDSKIMKILNDEGIKIARRTVAKYRDELNIPSSTDRKQIF